MSDILALANKILVTGRPRKYYSGAEGSSSPARSAIPVPVSRIFSSVRTSAVLALKRLMHKKIGLSSSCHLAYDIVSVAWRTKSVL